MTAKTFTVRTATKDHALYSEKDVDETSIEIFDAANGGIARGVTFDEYAATLTAAIQRDREWPIVDLRPIQTAKGVVMKPTVMPEVAFGD